MEEKTTCKICDSDCIKIAGERFARFDCEICGRYLMNDFENPPSLTNHHKFVLKHYFAKLPEQDERRTICIDANNINDIVESIGYPKTLIEKVDNVLGYFCKKTTFFGKKFVIEDTIKLIRILYCVDVNEFEQIIDYLVQENFIKNHTITLGENLTISVTIDGLQYYQNNIITKSKLNQCFVAMWFNQNEDLENHKPNMNKIYSEIIKPAIEHDLQYTSIRIDCIDYCNDINDEMIAQIRKSKFMIADLTGYRGGVYFEAGFAEGLGLPVIYTCHEKWLEGVDEKFIPKVHFDLNHRNIITWNENELDKFKKSLENRIKAVIV